jgi:hypothetical protein
MNKHLIILALETLHEQCKNDSVWSSQSDNKKRIKEIKEQIKIMKEYEFDYNFPNPIDGSNNSILIYKNKL